MNQIFPTTEVAGVDQDLSDAYLKSLDEAGLITYQRHRRVNGIRFADDNTTSTGGGSASAFKIRQGRVEDKATALMLTLITNTLNKAVDPDQFGRIGSEGRNLDHQQHDQNS